MNGFKSSGLKIKVTVEDNGHKEGLWQNSCKDYVLLAGKKWTNKTKELRMMVAHS